MKTHLKELSAALALPEHDLLLVGDGSGVPLGAGSCAWMVVGYAPTLDCIFGPWYGGSTVGTTNQAELQPYLHALWAYDSMRNDPKSGLVRVQVVSDSELTVRCANGQYRRKANGALWAALDWFEKSGYRISFNWVPRNSNPVSVAADAGASAARLALEELRRGVPC